MADLGNFDATKVDPNVGFDAMPAGEYTVIITASDRVGTKNGNGSYLKLEMQVVNGKFQNRKLWDNLNLDNPNAQAVQIARGTLSAICRAVGVLTPKDSAELHNRPLLAKVVVEKDPTYGEKNVVKSYKAIGATTPATAPTNGSPAPVAAATAPAARPWA